MVKHSVTVPLKVPGHPDLLLLSLVLMAWVVLKHCCGSLNRYK